MKRPCPRTLDKPILLWGLEPEDVAMVTLVAGLGGLITSPLWSGLVGIVMWCVLIAFKKDKPAGYMVHLLYHYGMPCPGLIFPLTKINHYAIR